MYIALRMELGAAGPACGGCRTPCSGPGGYPQRCNFMQLEEHMHVLQHTDSHALATPL